VICTRPESPVPVGKTQKPSENKNEKGKKGKAEILLNLRQLGRESKKTRMRAKPGIGANLRAKKGAGGGKDLGRTLWSLLLQTVGIQASGVAEELAEYQKKERGVDPKGETA